MKIPKKKKDEWFLPFMTIKSPFHESYIPAFTGLLLIVVVVISTYILQIDLPWLWSQLVISIACILTGFSGVMQIYTQRAPGLFGKTIQGIPAIVSGIIIVVIFWGVGGILFINLVGK